MPAAGRPDEVPKSQVAVKKLLPTAVMRVPVIRQAAHCAGIFRHSRHLLKTLTKNDNSQPQKTRLLRQIVFCS